MIFAAILAGGIGSRMGETDTPKQFLTLGDKPVIVHTIEKFAINSKFDKIIVLSPKNFINHTNDLIKEYFDDNSRIVVLEGGKTRNDTLINAIDYNAKWSKLCVIAEAKDPSGQSWVLAATGIEHVQSEFLKSVKFIYTRELFRQLVARNNVFGILINPWSQRFELPFEAVRGLAESWEEEFTRNGED